MSDKELCSIRASLCNLIIYTREERRLEYFEEIVNRMIQKFPCHILLIKKTGDKPDKVQKIEKKILKITEGDETTACEQVAFEISGDVAKNAYVILPFLLPDLPINLIWGDDPTKPTELLHYLQQYTSRLIFDSEGADDLEKFAQAMQTFLESYTGDAMDLTWARFFGWRNVFLQTFDSAERIEHLRSCESIVITYNAFNSDVFCHTDSQARYLQAWLATQLKWHFDRAKKGKTESTVTYHSGKHTITVTLKPVSLAAFNPGAMISVELNCRGGHVFKLERPEKNQEQVHIAVSSQETCDLPFTVPLSNPILGISFSKELLYGRTSPNYKAMLHTLAKQDQ